MKLKKYLPLLVFFLFFPAAAQARSETEIILHPLLFETVDMNAQLTNDGLELAADDELLTSSKPLIGATFTVYDATAKYHELLPGQSPQEVTEILAQTAVSEFEKIVELTSDANGEARTMVNPGSPAQPKVYVIVLTGLPDGVSQQMAPLVLGLPIRSPTSDEWLSELHLYPKFSHLGTIDFTLALDLSAEATRSFSIGDRVPYLYQINFPAEFKLTDNQEIKILQIFDGNLLARYDTLKVELTNRENATEDLIAACYPATPAEMAAFAPDEASKQGLWLVFNRQKLLAYLAAAPNSVLALRQSVILDAAALPDTALTNEAYLIIEETSPAKIAAASNQVLYAAAEDVYTYGHQFKKLDLATQHPLADAQFLLGNQQGTNFFAGYLLVTEKLADQTLTYPYPVWLSASEKNQLTAESQTAAETNTRLEAFVRKKAQTAGLTAQGAFTSGLRVSQGDGLFHFNGFAKGTYQLQEIAPPPNYLGNQTGIKVVYGKNTAETILDIFNKKQSVTSNETLPKAGENAQPKIIFSGLLLIAFALLWAYHTRRKTHE
ncbi:pilin N-terminal domain-containing protein [Enterococcus sp. LJL120]